VNGRIRINVCPWARVSWHHWRPTDASLHQNAGANRDVITVQELVLPVGNCCWKWHRSTGTHRQCAGYSGSSTAQRGFTRAVEGDSAHGQGGDSHFNSAGPNSAGTASRFLYTVQNTSTMNISGLEKRKNLGPTDNTTHLGKRQADCVKQCTQVQYNGYGKMHMGTA